LGALYAHQCQLVGRALLFVAAVRLRTTAALETDHETSHGDERNSGHCSAEQQRAIQGLTFSNFISILIHDPIDHARRKSS